MGMEVVIIIISLMGIEAFIEIITIMLIVEILNHYDPKNHLLH